MTLFSFMRALCAAAIVLTLTACGTPGVVRGDAPSAGEVAEPVYRLGPGDQLRIIVFGEEQLTGEFLVNAQGDIAYPLVGAVQANGMTLEEFSARLTEVLRNGYVRNPNVAVEVMAYRPFFILGEVERPGTYPYTANLTVENAVAIAQGYTYRAETRRIFIRRAGETVEREYRLPSNIRVNPGDTVRVGERRF
jgi:polysaccharide export outer membrane protein